MFKASSDLAEGVTLPFEKRGHMFWGKESRILDLKQRKRFKKKKSRAVY